jgi:hypothetical protein
MKRFLAFVFLLFTLMLLALYVASEKAARGIHMHPSGRPFHRETVVSNRLVIISLTTWNKIEEAKN